jgi:hypothetical protein
MDENMPKEAADLLLSLGHDVKSIHDLNLLFNSLVFLLIKLFFLKEKFGYGERKMETSIDSYRLKIKFLSH